jgi:Fe-S oxidoreductase
VQAGVLDARAARQPALLAAQQDPRHLAADRGLPLRGADPARRLAAHFDEFNDVADHCTICHKCVKPCPVDIDFGDVSIKMRNLLREQGKKKFNPGKAAAMAFLTMKDPATIKLVRTG